MLPQKSLHLTLMLILVLKTLVESVKLPLEITKQNLGDQEPIHRSLLMEGYIVGLEYLLLIFILGEVEGHQFVEVLFQDKATVTLLIL